jgi:hypothetical protein
MVGWGRFKTHPVRMHGWKTHEPYEQKICSSWGRWCLMKHRYHGWIVFVGLIVLLSKLAMCCNNIWYILGTMDFYVLGLQYPCFGWSPLYDYRLKSMGKIYGDEAFFLRLRVTRGCAYWESTNVKHPGFTMVKFRQMPLNWMASAAQTMLVSAVLITSKIHLIPFQ